MFFKPRIIFLVLLQLLQFSQSATVLKALPHWNRLAINAFGCPQGKVADVVLFLDISHHLSDEQFENQIQRAEHMVRLFRNFKERKNYNRIAIIALSNSKAKYIIKFKDAINTSKKDHTDEFVHILRKLHKNNETEGPQKSRRDDEITALKQLKRLSSQMRRSVAHVSFYFSADETVSRKDLKRARFIRRLGIYLYIFQLGQSQITYNQYKRMVHKPVHDFVFRVTSYDKIDESVKKLLDMEHCNMQISPPDETPKPICEAKRQVNLFLAIDHITLNGGKNEKFLKFTENFENQLKNTNGAKIEIEKIFNELESNSSNTVPDYNRLLEKLKKTRFSSLGKVGRESAQNTAVLFLNSNNHETKEMIKNAESIKRQKTEIYAIVVGKKRNFESIVSKPIDDHLFHVEDLQQLMTSEKGEIFKNICRGW